jgi:stage II sporulation protein D
MERLAAALILSAAASFAGTVRVRLWTNDAARAVTRDVDVEQYVTWVLNGEAGGFSSAEALKAMAVVARTFARANRGRHKADGYDFCDTTHCQDLRIAGTGERLARAAEATEGVILWWEGRPAEVYFHKHCGGRTADAEEVWPGAGRPYLRGFEDSFCLTSGRAPWSARLELEKISLKRIEVSRRTASGRAAALLTDRGTVAAEAFHLTVGRLFGWRLLKSRLYNVRTSGGFAVFEGYGEGHGAGLCQAGAEQRGRAGHDWRRILEAYFPGTKAGESAQDLRWREFSSERVTLLSAAGGDALQEAERALSEAITLTGISPSGPRPRVIIYPTVPAFRDATGEPGFVAASSRGRTIRIQPEGLLRSRGLLAATLRHEFIHLLLRQEAKAALPRWFEEGLALWLERRTAREEPLDRRTERRLHAPASEAELRAAYSNARAAVAALVRRHGLNVVMGWAVSGLPEDLAERGVVR